MNQQHVRFLDHFRGIAVALVFLFHCLVPAFNANSLPWKGWVRDFDGAWEFMALLPVTFGWCGVAIFFVVSGFCIHLSFQRAPAWKEFFLRRFFRIYPPYLIALLVFALLFEGRRLPFSSFPDYAQFFGHLFLIHNFHPQTLYGIVGAFWSIAVEVQLYLLYPVLLRLIARWGWRRTFVSVGALEVLLRLLGSLLASETEEMPKWITGFTFTYWLSWAIGVAVADAYLYRKPLPFVTWSIPLLTCAAFGSGFFKPLTAFSFLFFALLTAAGISKLLNGARFPMPFPRFVSRHLELAGIWSYSIYLLHQPIVEAVPSMVKRFFPEAGFSALAIFGLCVLSWFIVVPLSGLWYRVFEVWGIAQGKKFARPRSPR